MAMAMLINQQLKQQTSKTKHIRKISDIFTIKLVDIMSNSLFRRII
jgi:hypothetical protein